jgi:hypothetical protein
LSSQHVMYSVVIWLWTVGRRKARKGQDALEFFDVVVICVCFVVVSKGC